MYTTAININCLTVDVKGKAYSPKTEIINAVFNKIHIARRIIL